MLYFHFLYIFQVCDFFCLQVNCPLVSSQQDRPCSILTAPRPPTSRASPPTVTILPPSPLGPSASPHLHHRCRPTTPATRLPSLPDYLTHCHGRRAATLSAIRCPTTTTCTATVDRITTSRHNTTRTTCLATTCRPYRPVRTERGQHRHHGPTTTEGCTVACRAVSDVCVCVFMFKRP